MESIEAAFRAGVADQVRVIPEGSARFRVFTPFQFPDGDHLAIVLRRIDSQWVLSDEGHTLMHLSYSIDDADLTRGGRAELIDAALKTFDILEADGTLSLPVPDNAFGESLFDYVQALLKITDVTYLTRERVQTTFLEDLRNLVFSRFPGQRATARWHEPQLDPEAKYEVDYRIESRSGQPVFVFGLPNDDKVRDATITLLQLEEWQLPGNSIGIFEDQQTITRKVLARFTDHVDRQFSSLAGNEDRIAAYIERFAGSPT
jgi:hypothetical protein